MPAKTYSQELIKDLKLKALQLPLGVASTVWKGDELEITINISTNAKYLYRNTPLYKYRDLSSFRTHLSNNISRVAGREPKLVKGEKPEDDSHYVVSITMSADEIQDYLTSQLILHIGGFGKHMTHSGPVKRPNEISVALSQMTTASKEEIENAIRSGILNPGVVKYSYPYGFIYEEKKQAQDLPTHKWFIGDTVFDLNATVDMLRLAAIGRPIDFETKNQTEFQTAFSQLPPHEADNILMGVIAHMPRMHADYFPFLKAYYFHYAQDAKKIALIQPNTLFETLFKSDAEFRLAVIALHNSKDIKPTSKIAKLVLEHLHLWSAPIKNTHFYQMLSSLDLDDKNKLTFMTAPTAGPHAQATAASPALPIFIEACATLTRMQSTAIPAHFQALVTLEQKFNRSDCDVTQFIYQLAAHISTLNSFFSESLIKKYFKHILSADLPDNKIDYFLNALIPLYNKTLKIQSSGAQSIPSSLSQVIRESIQTQILTFIRNHPIVNINHRALKEILKAHLAHAHINMQDFLMIITRCNGELTQKAALMSLNEDLTLELAKKITIDNSLVVVDKKSSDVSIRVIVKNKEKSAANIYFACILTDKPCVTSDIALFNNQFQALASATQAELVAKIIKKNDDVFTTPAVVFILKYFQTNNELKNAANFLMRFQGRIPFEDLGPHISIDLFHTLATAHKPTIAQMRTLFNHLPSTGPLRNTIQVLYSAGYQTDEILFILNKQRESAKEIIINLIMQQQHAASPNNSAPVLIKGAYATHAISKELIPTIINKIESEDCSIFQSCAANYKTSNGWNKSAHSQELAEVLIKFFAPHKGKVLSTLQTLELYHILKPYMTDPQNKGRTFYEQLEFQYNYLERVLKKCKAIELYDPYLEKDPNFQAAELIKNAAMKYLHGSKGFLRRASQDSLEQARNIISETDTGKVLKLYDDYISSTKPTTLYKKMSDINETVKTHRPINAAVIPQ